MRQPLIERALFDAAVEDIGRSTAHQSKADADRAPSDSIVARLEVVRERLQPEDAVELAVPLFTTGFEIVGHNRSRGKERSLG
jgi:hypothetical protein